MTSNQLGIMDIVEEPRDGAIAPEPPCNDTNQPDVLRIQATATESLRSTQGETEEADNNTLIAEVWDTYSTLVTVLRLATDEVEELSNAANERDAARMAAAAMPGSSRELDEEEARDARLRGRLA